MNKIDAPGGSYRMVLPTFDDDSPPSIYQTEAILLVSSDALNSWMLHHDIRCTIEHVWNHGEHHFDLAVHLVFDHVDDAIFFKLTWADL